MNKISLSFFGLLALLLVVSLPSVTTAAPSMTLIETSAKSLPAQPIAEQLGQQLQSLVAPPTPTNEDSDEANQEPPPTFGTRALNVVINITDILRNQGQRFITDFGALPQLSDWLAQQRSDPRAATRWGAIWNDILSSAALALIGGIAAEFLLFPLRRTLRNRSPRDLVARAFVVAGLFFLRAVPIMIFVAASVTLLNQYEAQKLPRFVILNIVYALALARIVVSFLRGVFSPTVDGLRFVPASKEQAVYGYRWLRAFGLLIIFGYFCIDLARGVHVPEAALAAFVNALGLILVVMGVVVIVQKRAFVAHVFRGNLSAAQHDLSVFDSLRLWLARHWHVLAISYLVIGYAIAAMGVQDGLILMLRGTLLTLLILIAMRLLFRQIGIWEARTAKGSTTLYTLIKGMTLRLLVVGLAIAGGLASWGVDISALANAPLGHRLLGSVFSIGMTFFVLGLIYEFFSSMVDRQLLTHRADGSPLEVNARARTLLPMMRNAMFVLFMSIVGVVALSEAGINIGPLLAGAGVLGVAVGFGSQTLVKDFLTGLFIVLENTIAVGDVIKVGDHSGVVEAMSMRTLRLRDSDGGLHILPFSEVSQIVNLTRGFAHAVIKVNVASNADLDKAMDCMRAVGQELQKDADFKRVILDPVEMWGVDSINDSSITLVARMRTLPGEQWGVKRRFLLRLKQRFDQDGIPLPTSTTILVQKVDAPIEQPSPV